MSAKLDESELIELIFYGLKENNVDIKEISKLQINSIIVNYCKYCNHFQVRHI